MTAARTLPPRLSLCQGTRRSPPAAGAHDWAVRLHFMAHQLAHCASQNRTAHRPRRATGHVALVAQGRRALQGDRVCAQAKRCWRTPRSAGSLTARWRSPFLLTFELRKTRLGLRNSTFRQGHGDVRLGHTAERVRVHTQKAGPRAMSSQRRVASTAVDILTRSIRSSILNSALCRSS